jgi:uncharacterized protein YaaN involved in tellurite resistance
LIFAAKRRKLEILMTDDQFTRLEKYLDERFGLIDKRMDFNEQRTQEQLDAIGQRFDRFELRMDANEQRTREGFEAIGQRLDEMAGSVDRLTNTVDGIVGKLDTIETELTARNHQVDRRFDRQERWIKQLADHSSVRLDPQAG